MNQPVNHKIQITNPFPGLRAFRKSESHLFFGREENVADVIAKLEHNHFVAIVGTSGTGKSSLVRAGVLPALENQQSPSGDPLWTIVSITPGSTPIENLAQALSDHGDLSISKSGQPIFQEVMELMQSSSLGMVQALRPLLKPGRRILMLIDQFEEVFRFAGENDSTKPVYDQFVQILIDTVRQRDVPVYAILTLRSDFLGDCVAFEGLPEAINDGHYLVPRMTRAQMKRAVTAPIELANGKISPRLVQHITTDLGSNPDQLPILQHAMMRCWDYWKKNEISVEPMDLKHFKAIGDLDRALSSHADEAFNELNHFHQALAEKLFKYLTTKQSDNRGVRRPLSLLHLIRVSESTREDVLKSLEPFRKSGRNFISPDLDQPVSESTIFDISHESLMRGWGRLAQWVDEETESAEFYQRICAAALLYSKGESGLWRDPELQLALDWKERQSPNQDWAELYDANLSLALDFIEASRLAAIEEKRRKARRVRGIRIAVASFVVVISILAAWAMVQTALANSKSLEAQQKSEEALAQKNVAETAREEAQAASEEADKNRQLAQEQARIAGDQARLAEEQKQIAEQQRGLAVASEREARSQQLLADQKSQEAILQKQKADSARFDALRLRYLATGQNLAFESSQITSDPQLSALLALASYDFARSNNGNMTEARLYHSVREALLAVDKSYTPVLMQHPEDVVAFSVINERLGLIDLKGGCLVRDIISQEQHQVKLSILGSGNINTAYLDLVSGRIAIGLDNNILQVTGIEAPGRGQIFGGHTGLIRAVAFRSVEPSLISGGRDGRVILWKNGLKQDVVELQSRVRAIAANDDTNIAIAGCEDGSTYVIDLGSGQYKLLKARAGTRVDALALSRKGDLVAIGYSDGITQLLSADGSEIREVPGAGSVVEVAIDPDHQFFTVASSGRKVRIYDLSATNTQPREIALDRPVKEMSVDPSTGNIFVYCSDHSIRQFHSGTAWYIQQLRAQVSRQLTEEEWQTYVGSDIPYNSYTPGLGPVATTAP